MTEDNLISEELNKRKVSTFEAVKLKAKGIADKVQGFKKSLSEQQNKRMASQLQDLKKKREFYEGKARLSDLAEKEKERINKAKAKTSFSAKIQKQVSKFDNYAKKLEAEQKKRPPIQW